MEMFMIGPLIVMIRDSGKHRIRKLRITKIHAALRILLRQCGFPVQMGLAFIQYG
jgi:hypothetical protein